MQSQFITTENINTQGEKTERLVWRRIQSAFTQRHCLAYWRYPIFVQGARREPDILIADLQLGLIIIEVKSLEIEQIQSINGHNWQYQHFYTDTGNPYQQAESQLFSLLKYTEAEPSLSCKITGMVVVALPLILEKSWLDKGFNSLPSNPPILFQQHFQSSYDLPLHLEKIPPVVRGKKLDYSDWKLLTSILGGKPVFTPPSHRVLSHPHSRGKILAQLKPHIFSYDILQEKIAKQIPPGPQRIRGIPGSGKTVLLCQKAAQIHLKHPDWHIAIVFFSRSLYCTIRHQVNQWLGYFTANQYQYSANSNLQILHAWGGKQPGLYSLICQKTKIPPITVNETATQPPQEALAEACVQLLQQTSIPPIFDAILIDEAQDLISQSWRYQQKQPFYWMSYQALRPTNPLHPQQRRLIWAYDEWQSIHDSHQLTAGELLGRDLAHLVTGVYPGGINKTEIISCSYRTPAPLINLAYGLGMGLYRQGGMLRGMTNIAEWEAIGYQVTGDLIPGKKVTIARDNHIHPLPKIWSKSLISFDTYNSRQQELTALAQKIIDNLRYDGLRPSREILVIILGDYFTATPLETYVAKFLTKQGIDIHIPDGDNFWCEGAVTISRIHRAKGNEADLVYLIGLDNIAQAEDNLALRNQLFIAITRSRGWLNLSGIDYYPLYQEIRELLSSREQITFTFSLPQLQQVTVTPVEELKQRYALGDRHFQNINLSGANLAGIYLTKANLIGANLSYTNLQNAQLNQVNLIAANLQGADLRGANLHKAKLIGANLTDANLTNADLTDAEMTESNPETAS